MFGPCKACQFFESRDSTCRCDPPKVETTTIEIREKHKGWEDSGAMPQTNSSGYEVLGEHKVRVRASWPVISDPAVEWCGAFQDKSTTEEAL